MDSGIWEKPPEWFKIWMYILMAVNFKENWLPEGSKYMTYEEIKMNCKGVTVHQIQKAVSWLKASGNIATQKATRWMVVSVANYSQYQKDTITPKATQKATEEPDRSQTEATLYIEEGKKERKKECNNIKDNTIVLSKNTKNTKGFFDIIKNYEETKISTPEEIETIKEMTEGILEWQELFKFYNYWVETWKSWKQRWEMQKTFELKRRLATWKWNNTGGFETKKSKQRVFWE